MDDLSESFCISLHQSRLLSKVVVNSVRKKYHLTLLSHTEKNDLTPEIMREKVRAKQLSIQRHRRWSWISLPIRYIQRSHNKFTPSPLHYSMTTYRTSIYASVNALMMYKNVFISVILIIITQLVILSWISPYVNIFSIFLQYLI